MAINIKNKPIKKRVNRFGEPPKIEEPRVLNIVDDAKNDEVITDQKPSRRDATGTSPKEQKLEDTKQLSINLSPDEHFAFKAYAMIECRKSMKDVFLEAWELHKKRYKK